MAYITWQTGGWLRCLSGWSRSTIFSNGMSWFANAPRATSRDRRTISRKVGSPERSLRSAMVLAKKPMSPSSSVRLRLAMGVPTTMSSCPRPAGEEHRVAPRRYVMKRVTPSARAKASRAATIPGGSSKRW